MSDGVKQHGAHSWAWLYNIDFRVRWLACGLVYCTALQIAVVFAIACYKFYDRTDVFQYVIDVLQYVIQDAVQMVSLVVAALMILFQVVDQQERTLITSRQEIYQRLELESISLFRFDIQNPDLAAYLWEDSAAPSRLDATWSTRLQQYVAQVLNLFEMAVRLRQENVMPAEVFGSWVIWINSLCESEHFSRIWRDHDPDLRWNYVPLLRKIVDAGLAIHHGDPPPPAPLIESTKKFFEQVSKELGGCEIVEKWYSIEDQ